MSHKKWAAGAYGARIMRTNGYKGQPWYQYVPSGEFHLAMGDHWRRRRLAGSLLRMNLECSQYLSVGLSQRQSHTWTLASARFARCPHLIGMMRWAMRLVILMTIASVGDISLYVCVFKLGFLLRFSPKSEFSIQINWMTATDTKCPPFFKI